MGKTKPTSADMLSTNSGNPKDSGWPGLGYMPFFGSKFTLKEIQDFDKPGLGQIDTHLTRGARSVTREDKATEVLLLSFPNRKEALRWAGPSHIWRKPGDALARD